MVGLLFAFVIERSSGLATVPRRFPREWGAFVGFSVGGWFPSPVAKLDTEIAVEIFFRFLTLPDWETHRETVLR
jgi:hypothetical protein